MRANFKSWCTLVLLGLLVALCQAQEVDFSESRELGKPYSELWNTWAHDGRPQTEQIKAIAGDFRALAAHDFIAACSAFVDAKKITPAYFSPLFKELGPDLSRGLKAHNAYVVNLYLHKHKGKSMPTYPDWMPKPGQPWPGLEAHKAPLRVAQGKPTNNASSQAAKPKARNPKFKLWEAVYSRQGKSDRAPVAYIGGYFPKEDRYLVLGIFRPMNDGPYSGKPNDRYMDASFVEANHVRSNPKTYMCPGCEGRGKRDVGRYVSMSRQSNKDRIVVNKNQPLKRVECGYCLGRGWGTIYSIETKKKRK